MLVIRNIHKYLGISLGVFFIISATTGFLRANYTWYWKPGYKEPKHHISENLKFIREPGIGILEIKGIVMQKSGIKDIERIELFNLYSKLVYRIYSDSSVVMVDAMSGEILSPINEQLAAEIASQYVKEFTPVKDIEELMEYTPFKGKKPLQVYKVNFDNKRNTQIFVDKYSGDVVEELDNMRRFAHFIVKLHDFNFFNLKRTSLSIIGISLVFFSISGIFLFSWQVFKIGNSSNRGGVRPPSLDV